MGSKNDSLRDRAGRCFKLALLIVLSGALSFGGTFNIATAAGAKQDTVRIMVGLKRIDGDVAVRRELRRALKEVRKISDTVPRSYWTKRGRVRAKDLRRWRVVEVRAGEAGSVLDDLKNNPMVAEAYVEKVYEAAVVPDDPMFIKQWGLMDKKEPLADIKAYAAWDKTRGSDSTVIAVLDAGVDIHHEDLKNKIWVNQGEIGGNAIDDDGNGFVDDVYGWDFSVRGGQPGGIGLHNHATHVAGIAAADSNNGIGVAGVDWRAKIMTVRVLGPSGYGREEWIVAGIDYAVANGADVINMSLAGSPSPAVLEAVENAYASGVVVVAAAGNWGRDTTYRKVYPVCAEREGVNMVLGVGATDDDGEPASFSNYGKCVDVSAPGKKIVSTVAGSRYGTMSGTSMSAPYAAGTAGLYLSLHPGASPAEVIAAVSSGDSFAGRRKKIWNSRYKGLLNAAKAVGVVDVGQVPAVDEDSDLTGPRDKGMPVVTVTMEGPDETRLEQRVVYSVMVGNSGSAAARGVRVEGRFDRDLEFAPELSSSECSGGRRRVECVRGELGAGDKASFRLVFKLADDTRCSSILRSRATVYTDEGGRSRRQDRSERVKTKVVCD